MLNKRSKNSTFGQRFIEMKKLIIASTSTIHGGNYLEYLLPTLEIHFKDCRELLFIPYARPGGISHEGYTETVRAAFAKINKTVKGLHEFANPTEAIQKAEGIFTGGGIPFYWLPNCIKTT